MKEVKLLISIIVIIIFSNSVLCIGGAEGGETELPDNFDYANSDDYSSLSDEQIGNLDPQELADNWNSVPSSVRNQLTSDQLSKVDRSGRSEGLGFIVN